VGMSAVEQFGASLRDNWTRIRELDQRARRLMRECKSRNARPLQVRTQGDRAKKFRNQSPCIACRYMFAAHLVTFSLLCNHHVIAHWTVCSARGSPIFCIASQNMKGIPGHDPGSLHETSLRLDG